MEHTVVSQPKTTSRPLGFSEMLNLSFYNQSPESLVPGTNSILGCSLFCRNVFNRGRDAEKKQPDRVSPTSASSSRNSAACEGKHASSKDERLQDGRGGLDRKSVVIIIRREFQEQEKSEI